MKGPSLPTLHLELILLLWQHYLRNKLCSLKTCRCLALAEVHRVNKVGVFSMLMYQLAYFLFENFCIEHAASFFISTA